jgi:hypothetical protein
VNCGAINYFNKKMNKSIHSTRLTIKEYWKGILLLEIFGFEILTK